MNRFVYQANR